jgi:hypothetical protein
MLTLLFLVWISMSWIGAKMSILQALQYRPGA